MSTSSGTVHNSNVACCNIPPVKSDYQPKGIYKSYAGFKKAYVTGPEKPGKLALVSVYDIFGFKPQTQQGADILAEDLKAQVVMPDFFEGDEPWPVDNFPPTTDEDKKKFQAWFGGFANPANHVPKLINVAKTLKEEGAEFVVAYGYCWGGKVSIVAGTQEGTPFDAVSIIHPAMLSVDDAEKLNVPLGMFISNDESKEEFEKIVNVISKKSFADKNDSRIFDSFHGFAAARADLDDPDNKAKYVDLYCTLIKFVKKASGAS
ncbi:hypothetical protein PHLCEN_2v997 [Hermanssonia centrifuga]|uniref:Dienelactone hydrolase domain-containing protein n=1 Tax=Hermanssonia centrifuga TaxID=98765 RepID=A0A2R6S4A3_9APHY|nr:hypothetical protein PHLCEN_2v997 [Hermanssonia centrifuga]